MNRAFVDTSFFIALLVPGDARHRACIEFDRGYAGRYVTSEFVLIELANWLADPPNRSVFIDLHRALQADPQTTILPASSEWFGRGVQLYGERPDKAWSLIDCISFLMMQEYDLTGALTSDRHFAQAGFQVIP